MNTKLQVRLILTFLLLGAATVVYAAGTSSSSSSWGTRSSDRQESSDVPQVEEPEDNQESPSVSQGTGRSYTQNNPSVSLYDQGMKADKNGDYQKARTLFKQALSLDRNNPDILNMLAHAQLKVGMIDESLENYKKALQLRPRFPEAREYLGEAYIQAALREIGTLKSYGGEAVEQLEDLVKEFKKAAERL